MQLAAVGPTRIEQIIYRADKGDGPKRYRHDFDAPPVAIVRGERLSFPVVVKPDQGPGQAETGWIHNPSKDVNKERELSVADRHQLKIARDSLRMPEAMLGVMGGPSKKDAREIITRLTGKDPLAGRSSNPKTRMPKPGEIRSQGDAFVLEARRESYGREGPIEATAIFEQAIRWSDPEGRWQEGYVLKKASKEADFGSVRFYFDLPSGSTDGLPQRGAYPLLWRYGRQIKKHYRNPLFIVSSGEKMKAFEKEKDAYVYLRRSKRDDSYMFGVGPRGERLSLSSSLSFEKNPLENQTSRMIGRNALQPNPILSKGGEMLTARKTRSVSGVNHYVVSGPSRQSVSRRSRSMVLSSSDPVYPNPRHKRGHGVRIFVNPISKHGAKVWLGRAAAVAGGVGIYFLAEWGLAKLDFFAKVHPSWMPLAVAGVGAAAGVVGAMVFKSTIIGLAIAAFPVIKGVWDAVKHYRALSAPLPASQGPASQSIPGLGYLSENQIAALPPGSIVRDEDGNDWNVGGNQIADNQIANFPMATRSVSGFPISRLGDGRGIVRNF